MNETPSEMRIRLENLRTFETAVPEIVVLATFAIFTFSYAAERFLKRAVAK